MPSPFKRLKRLLCSCQSKIPNQEPQLNNQGQSRRIKYKELKTQIRPLDIILFKGTDAVSKTIQTVQKLTLGNGDWSHCGIVLTTDIVPIKNGIPGELYVWESTFDKIKDVELNNSIFGVQIHPLPQVVKYYKGRVAWCRLKQNPLYNDVGGVISNIKSQMIELYEKYNHLGYDFNPARLLSTVYPECDVLCGSCCDHVFDPVNLVDLNYENIMPKLQDQFLKLIINHMTALKRPDTSLNMHMINTRLFCSELVALVYINLGILPSHLVPHNIAPVEFLGHTNEVELPVVIDPPVTISI